MSTKTASRIGTCALIGQPGKLVKSHLIPRALTNIGTGGEPYYEAGLGAPLQRKWSSWYDSHLVTRAGEDVLAAIDAKGITALRTLRLVWKSWENPEDLGIKTEPGGLTLRSLQSSEFPQLRLFILSLLWRCAASTRAEMAEIVIPPEDLERLRGMVVGNSTEPETFYPASLLQFSSKGPPHNRAPSRFVGVREDVGPTPAYRFYFDGLVVLVFPTLSQQDWAGLQPVLVGQADRLEVMTMPFENSAQLDGLRLAVAEASVQQHSFGTFLGEPKKGGRFDLA